jgi:hypothetical protein
VYPSEPRQSTTTTLAVLALSFTMILIQVQAAAQGSTHDLLPILIAALLVLAGATRSNRPEA